MAVAFAASRLGSSRAFFLSFSQLQAPTPSTVTVAVECGLYGVKQKQLYSYLRSDSYIITQNKLLYPIPKFEIEVNPQITQNPGY